MEDKGSPNGTGTPLRDQDWAGTASHIGGKLAPADKGWILGFVLVFAVFQGANLFINIKQEEGEALRTGNLIKYFELLEANRNKMEENRAMENRELLRIVESLTKAVARDSDRLGRAVVEKARESEKQ